MPPKQRQIKIEQKGALAAMQRLEGRSDEELEAETRFRAAAQAILGARAAERMDAKRSREHFKAAIAARKCSRERLASIRSAARAPRIAWAAARNLVSASSSSSERFSSRCMAARAPFCSILI